MLGAKCRLCAARAAAIRGARMTISTSRSAAINAGDRKGVFEDRPDHVVNGSKHGISRAQRPTRGILRETQSEVTCRSRSAALASPAESHMGNAGSEHPQAILLEISGGVEMRRIAQILLVNIAVFLGLALCLEGTARIYIWATRGSGSAGMAQRTKHLLYEPFLMYGTGTPWDDLFAPYRRKGRFGEEESYRLLLIGGSTAQGFPTQLLEENFERRFPEIDFEVINAGMGGFNARQELILLALWGPMLKPDLIISLTGANDMIHRLRMERAGTFYLDDSYRSTLTHPFFAPVIEVLRRSQAVQGIIRLKQRMSVRSAEDYLDAVQVFVEAQDSVDALVAGWCASRVLMLQPYRTFKKPLAPEEEAFTLYNYRKLL